MIGDVALFKQIYPVLKSHTVEKAVGCGIDPVNTARQKRPTPRSVIRAPGVSVHDTVP